MRLAHAAVTQPTLHACRRKLPALLEDWDLSQALERALRIGLDPALLGRQRHNTRRNQVVQYGLTKLRILGIDLTLTISLLGILLVTQGQLEILLADGIATHLGHFNHRRAVIDIGVNPEDGKGQDDQTQNDAGNPTLCTVTNSF